MATSDPTIPDTGRFSIRLPRPLWIGLSAVVLVVVVVGLHVGVPVYRQHVAILDIERVSGYVETEPAGPEWLREAFGDERMRSFEVVTFVALGTALPSSESAEVTDATLASVACFSNLEQLWVQCTNVTDAGMAQLSDLSALQVLYLCNNPQVTDAGLIHLKRLPRLQELRLDEANVTDAGLEHLQGLKTLRVLWLNDTKVTGAGLQHLQVTSVRELHLDNTDVTDAGLVHLKRLSSLAWLSLKGNAKVTPAGLDDLAQALPMLQVQR